MIAELPGGKEIPFPDYMEEEHVDRICALLVEAMQAAEDAKAETKVLRARLDALAATAAKPGSAATPPDNSALLRAIQELKASSTAGFQRLERVAMADTMLVFDNAGEVTRARKVINE